MSASIETDAVRDDLEVPVPGPTLRSARGGVSSIPAGTSAPDVAVARVEAHADELAVHLHVLDAPVRLERRAQPGLVDPGHEEVLVGVLDAEQLVADRAADDVRVEAERADVAADGGRHRADCARRPAGARADESLLQVRDGLDLDERSRRQLRDLERSSGRAGGRRRGARRPRSSPAKSSRSMEEHARLDELVERAAGRLEDRREVREHLLGLLR